MKKRAHEHYCQQHDHRWRCEQDPCILHEAVSCGLDFPESSGRERT